MIALVTGMAIAAFDVSNFPFCNAIFNSSASLSGWSKIFASSGIHSNLCA